ncbi:MAG: DUF1987 domain-containing protein [Bacteroidetes bacterium]|nr:DUF1987 domain-containing protein [Bacteroidota bacterium]
MKKLVKINQTDLYPTIIMDKESGVFEIKGVSLPLDGKDLYMPVLDFLDEYVQAPNKVTLFVFNLKYFNISSSKMFLFMLYKLKELYDAGNSVVVIWSYDDEDIREAGEDFQHMVDIPFQFKEVFDAVSH